MSRTGAPIARRSAADPVPHPVDRALLRLDHRAQLRLQRLDVRRALVLAAKQPVGQQRVEPCQRRRRGLARRLERAQQLLRLDPGLRSFGARARRRGVRARAERGERGLALLGPAAQAGKFGRELGSRRRGSRHAALGLAEIGRFDRAPPERGPGRVPRRAACKHQNGEEQGRTDHGLRA